MKTPVLAQTTIIPIFEWLGLKSSKPFTLNPYACVNTPENVTKWEYFAEVYDFKSFLT